MADSNFPWANELSMRFLKKDYLLPGQSLDERVDVICETAEKKLNYPGFASKFRENLQKGWYSLSTPVWTNFGTDRGLPISCYNSHFSDTIESLLGSTHAELAMMTKLGGGTSAYYGDVRGRGAVIKNNGHSFGSVHFAKHHESLVTTCSQGSTRRGNFAGYWPIDHPDVESGEVLGIKTEGHPIQHISYGLCVTDDWLKKMVAGDKKKREIWAKVLHARKNTGFPYILFIDNINRALPPWYKDRGYVVKSSNLCSEVTPTSNHLESFVCCLASMNVFHFDQWRGTDAVKLLAYFLDAVITEFIEKASGIAFMERAVRYAVRHRSLGIGQLGWHSFLQSKMIPFESMEAKRYNVTIAKEIQAQATEASREMAARYGEPEVTEGYGHRNALWGAIAPTKSSSFILEQMSEGVEPCRANVEIKDLAKGKFTLRNRYLEALLVSKGVDVDETFDSIIRKGGSVQHLTCLTEHEKAVFKTFAEISQIEVINQAAQRQPYIDQSQSLNVMIHPSVPTRDINSLHLQAWESGVKSMYYQHSVNAAQEFSRNILSCSSCEA